MRGAVCVLAATLTALTVPPTDANPYTPDSDDEILERLPPGLRSADLRRQREELAQDPENLRDSVEMAQSYLDTARSEGDPRFLGHAQAILAPWWDQPSPPASVLIRRALVRIANWEFDRALADLELAPADGPEQGSAALARLEIGLARGDIPGARQALALLGAGVSPLARTTAEVRVGRFGGELEGLQAALEQALAEAPEADQDERQGALRVLADLAEQRGQTGEALRHYATLAAHGRRDVARLAGQADLLLSLGRSRDAADLLRDEAAVDGLAIRWLVAMARLPACTAEEAEMQEVLARRVSQRLEARRRRGEAAVVLDETLFLLRPGGDPRAALARARELWTLRREPGDARLLWQAAQAATDPDAARPALEWSRAHQYVDARLPTGDAGTGFRP